MNVTQTSIAAMVELEQSGKAGLQRNTILMTVLDNEREQGYTRKELQLLTGYESNVITGRVYELVKAEHLNVAGKRECEVTGSNVEYLLTNPEKVIDDYFFTGVSS